MQFHAPADQTPGDRIVGHFIHGHAVFDGKGSRHTCGFPWARGVACTSLFLASLPSLCEVSMVVLGETRPSWEILISFHRLRGNLL